MSERRNRNRMWRSASLVILGLLLGTLMLTPATAHFTTNTQHLGKHAWQQFIKQKADKRYADNKLKYVRTAAVTVPPAGIAGAQAFCPSGWYATGGGWVPSGPGFVELGSFPSDGTGGALPSAPPGAGRTAWTTFVLDLGSGGGTFRGYVICARVDKPSGNYAPGSVAWEGPSEPEWSDVQFPDVLELPAESSP